MLKRCQVLLTEWQEEYIRVVAERYDQSFSEVLRIILSEGFLYIIPLIHTEFKAGITGKELAEMTKKAGSPDISIEERHRYISKVYFEARKAVEHSTSKLKKKRKFHF
jgi:hypothetical protein